MLRHLRSRKGKHAGQEYYADDEYQKKAEMRSETRNLKWINTRGQTSCKQQGKTVGKHEHGVTETHRMAAIKARTAASSTKTEAGART
jgi:hypothetical protein